MKKRLLRNTIMFFSVFFLCLSNVTTEIVALTNDSEYTAISDELDNKIVIDNWEWPDTDLNITKQELTEEEKTGKTQEELIQLEKEKPWVLNLDNSFETIDQVEVLKYLPSQIQAKIEDKDYFIDVKWNLDFLQEELPSGEYLIQGEIDSSQYVLSSEAEPIEVNLLWKTEVDDLEDEVNMSTDEIETYHENGQADYGEFSNHILDTGVSPSGTQIDLYDYWFFDSESDRFRNDYVNTTTEGINGLKNPIKFIAHNLLWFNEFNKPYASSFVTENIVARTLDSGSGIPKYGQQILDDSNPEIQGFYDKPMDVIFGKANSQGKKVFQNVKNLLQINKDGYYYYDAKKNFAEFNEQTNSFTLYDSPGVVDTTHGGQFFPFNQAGEIFEENTSGELINKSGMGWDKGDSIDTSHPQRDTRIHHFFGLSMNTNFVQMSGGTNKGEDVVYSFSGDDDVWVFIDGVLVGDLGGMHAPINLNINFKTGEVQIRGEHTNPGDPTPTNKTTNLRQCFEDAGVSTSDFKEGTNTFSDGTEHTLSFFYLERGNDVANMSLSYNLIESSATSTIKKVDDSGSPLGEVSYELIKTDETYSAEEQVIFSGKTNNEGIIQFIDESNKPITLKKLQNLSNYYILRETSPPDGYRKMDDVHLSFVEGEAVPFWRVENQWNSGAYSQTIANFEVYSLSKEEKIILENGGKLLPVIKEKDTENYYFQNSELEWEKGDINSVIAHNINDLKKDESSGFYKGSLELPFNYSSSKYSVSVLLIDQNLSTKEINSYNQTFSSGLVLSNIRNQFEVLKVDSEDNPIEGVEFEIYESKEDAIQEINPYDHGYTDSTGYIVFGIGGNSNNKKPLKTDSTYYLKEKNVSDDYIISDAITDVIVTKDGVYANAGDNSDEISVGSGIGRVVETMKPFATDNIIDSSLYNIKAKVQYVSDPSDWSNAISLRDVHYVYDKNGYVFFSSSGPNTELTFVNGWYNRLYVEQCKQHMGVNWKNKQNLSGINLGAIFTGRTVVKVENDKHPYLLLEKKVVGEKTEQKSFEFTINIKGLEEGAELQCVKNPESSPENITIYNGRTFNLNDQEIIKIQMPERSPFTVTEATGNYSTSYYLMDDSSKIFDSNVYENTSGLKLNKELHIVYENCFDLKNFNFTKIGENDVPLQGARFVMYEQVKDENLDDTFIPIDQNGDIEADFEQKDHWIQHAKKDSDSKGVVEFNDLKPNRVYRLIEYQAPENYVLPKGQWILKYSKDKDKFEISSIENPPAFENADNNLQVKNYKYKFLPLTGGNGAMYITLIGIILMCLGGIWKIIKIKRDFR